MIFIIALLWIFKTPKTNIIDAGELKIKLLEQEPINRKFAWNGSLPDFIDANFDKAMERGINLYDCHVEYHYMNNDIIIGWIASGPTISTNNIYLESASIYKSSNNDIVIYGYEGRAFKKLTVSQEGTAVQTVIPDYHIPLAEKAIMAYEIKNGYYLSIGERIALYKNQKQVGEAITIEDTPYRIYQNMILTTEGTLYMPYVITEDGEESLYMQVVASRIEESYLTDNSSKIVDGELLDINSMRIGNTKFPVVTNGKMFEVYVPNEFKTYQKYMAGETELTPEMDLGWHSVQIY